MQRAYFSFFFACFALLVISTSTGHAFRSPIETHFSLEHDIHPPLLYWKELRDKILRANCALLISQFLHTTPCPSPETIPLICRTPIAVIVTIADGGSGCPSCDAFKADLFSKTRLAELNALRSTSQINVVLHRTLGTISPATPSAEVLKTIMSMPEEGFVFSDFIQRYPLTPIFDETDAELEQEMDGETKLLLEEIAVAGNMTDEEKQVVIEAGLRVGRAAAEKYWKELMDDPKFKAAYNKSYAGEGEYALRVLFLWPHNGSVMPITGTNWELYVQSLPDRGEEQLRSVRGEEKHSHEEHPSEIRYNSHLYISAQHFIKNCVVAWGLMNRLLTC